MCSCHSILECCVTSSGVKLSIRSFVLFHFSVLSYTNTETVELTVVPLSILLMMNQSLYFLRTILTPMTIILN